MKRILVVAFVCLVLISSAPQNAAAQSNGRIARLTALLDYVRGSVEFDGTVQTPDGKRPDLSAWGFVETLPSFRSSDGRWNIHGSIDSARLLLAGASGVYHLQINSLALAPGDNLTLIVPFVIVDYPHIDPPPDNLSTLISPTLSPETPPSLIGVQYTGSSGRTQSLDIPFAPVRKQITLQVTPLIGEMLLGHTDSFRLSGNVVYDGLADYGEFNRHCVNDLSSRVLYQYRVADLLFSLDSPPFYNSGLLSAAYQYKPSFLFVSVDLATCRFDAKQGRVEANFGGRASSTKSNLAELPQAWIDAMTADYNREMTVARGGREFELQFGDIALAPGDVLTVTVPAAQIFDVQPSPTRYIFAHDSAPEIAYEGPAHFVLRILYFPDAALFLNQIPATARALVRSSEFLLPPLLDPRGAPITWSVLIAGIALLAARGFLRKSRIALILSAVGWTLAAVALYFGLRGAFGLLVLAVLVYIGSLQADKRDAASIVRAVIALALILGALYLDGQAESAFIVLSTLQLESTPFTPLIFLVLGLALTVVFASTISQRRALGPAATCSIALVLVAFASFDVLQKSLLGLAVIGLAMLYIAYRSARASSDPHEPEITSRVHATLKSRLVPVGVGLMVLFAAQYGLQSTTAYLGTGLGLLGTLLMPMLLIVSILQGFLTIGALFILVYSILPFKAGYLKAVTLGLFLLVLFFVGTGSDDRLISSLDSLIVGRLVYYVSVPLLIGLYFDIVRFMHTEQDKQVAEGKPAAGLSLEQAAVMYLTQLQGAIGTFGAIASIVAPGVYRVVAGTPLVSTYFDVLTKLVTVSLGA